ncbi:MFS general substrate transporter [Clavulina sp. PMI_390]|nr:MFS general substrate transporter [Clavulina sp. PMI_390]
MDPEKSPIDDASKSDVNHQESIQDVSSTGIHFSAEEAAALNKRVVRKLDLCIMPCLIMMYLANYVDRNNVAAARLKGLSTDLHLTPIEYSNVISLFYVTYIALQPFATNLLAHIKYPTYFISVCMFAWGIVSLCTGFTTNYNNLLAVRLLLGVCEAVFYPGALFTLSKFYTREEIGKRAAWFYSASLTATGFGSLFAAGVIGGLHGVHGVAGWRYLFYVEGAATCGIAVFIALLLPNFPGNAYFLTPEERKWAVHRIVMDGGQVDDDDNEAWYTSLIINLKNPLTYLMAVTWWLLTSGLSFNAYSPTLVASLGFSGTQALLLNAPPYALALITANLNSWHSDKVRERSLHIVLGCIVAIVGCIILLATTELAPRFVGIFLMTAGYMVYTIIIGWASQSFPGRPKRRAATIGWMSAFANTANLAGGYYFVSDKFGPTYRGSFAVILAMFIAALFMTLVTRAYLKWLNRKLERLEQELLAGNREVANNKLLVETANAEGIDAFEAAKLAASYRYWT